jgi:hypothetical protein
MSTLKNKFFELIRSMPFLNQIVSFINDTLKANLSRLQPAKYYGLSTQIARIKEIKAPLELLPAIVEGGVIKTLLTPDDKLALQLYHKLVSNTYSFEKKSYGDSYDVKSTSEMTLVVTYNSKLTGKAREVLEPVVLFSLPQKISQVLLTDLELIKCLITPISSNMDAVQVFKQEYPQSSFFLNESLSMFSIRYRIEMSFSQACVDACLCDPVESVQIS